MRKIDIAIIGASGKFPKSRNIEEFWDNLTQGKELIHRYTDEELKLKGVDSILINQDNYVKVASLIDDPESFDYEFFGYTKEEAKEMDPQIRILHEYVWLGLENAGCSTIKDAQVGLFLSANDNLNWRVHSHTTVNNLVNPFFKDQISNKNFISSLISYKLNLKGPSLYIDTACSSSLVGVHLACRSLLMRECNIAVAGGVKIDSRVSFGYRYEEDMILSKDGHCKAFDNEATGTVPGEGVGVVVLKRLSKAIEDKDHILGVIRGSAINNDGSSKVGYSSPSIVGQHECIKQAHKIAGIEPQDISYIECHGTGTKRGDPIELEALNRAFQGSASKICAIGSVKTNLGHLDGASGIVGIIKTLWSLKNKKIPPSLHFKTPNTEIDFSASPFYVNTVLQNWQDTEGNPLLAGVSSFGIGGTNAHIVLEEYKNDKEITSLKSVHLLPFSAKNEKSLEKYKSSLETHILNVKEPLDGLSYSLTEKETFKFRDFIVYNQNQQSIEDFPFLLSKKEKNHDNNKTITFLFPGQGCQYYKMGKDVYSNIPFIRKIMDEGFVFLKALTGEEYKSILGYEDNEVDPNKIHDTKYAQPLLFLLEYALAKFLLRCNVIPTYLLGHSLGEYVAACISEVFTFPEALKLVARRGSLMSALPKGSMLSVDASLSILNKINLNHIEFAAVNSPNTCVLSGSDEEISKIQGVLSDKGISFRKLKTSHAFHSKMMEEMINDFELELSAISFKAPKYTIISNLTAQKVSAEEITSNQYWINQLRHTVNFCGGIEYLSTKNQSINIEIGPGPILGAYLRQHENYNSDIILHLIGKAKGIKNDEVLLASTFGVLWQKTIPIDWSFYNNNKTPNKVPTPPYIFTKTKLPVRVDPIANINFLDNNKKVNIEESISFPSWKRSIFQSNTVSPEKKSYLLFSIGQPNFLSELKRKLIEKQHRVIEIKYGNRFKKIDEQTYEIDYNDNYHFNLIYEKFIETIDDFKQIIYLPSTASLNQENISQACRIAIEVTKFISMLDKRIHRKIIFTGCLNHKIIGNEKTNVPLCTIQSIFDTYSQETNNISSYTIDIEGEIKEAFVVDKIYRDLEFNNFDTTIAYRRGKRWVRFYEYLNVSLISRGVKTNFDHKLFLITGGLGMVGVTLTKFLSSFKNTQIVLLGRSPLPKKNTWSDILESSSASKSIKNKISKMIELYHLNKNIHYFDVDISEYDALENIVENIEREFGKIEGVIHAAGNLDPQTFASLDRITDQKMKEQFDPKINGTLNLFKIFENREIQFGWITSSLSSILGGVTYGAYSVANRFMDAYISSKSESLVNWRLINFDGIGSGFLSLEEIEKVFQYVLHIHDTNQVVVSKRPLNNDIIELFTTSQEKVSKALALQEVENRETMPNLSANFEAPITNIEKRMCELWEIINGSGKIGLKHHFFEMGGDSLRAMTLINRIEKEFNIELTIKDIYDKPTVKDLSEEIELILDLRKIKEDGNGNVKNSFKI